MRRKCSKFVNVFSYVYSIKLIHFAVTRYFTVYDIYILLFVVAYQIIIYAFVIFVSKNILTVLRK